MMYDSCMAAYSYILIPEPCDTLTYIFYIFARNRHDNIILHSYFLPSCYIRRNKANSLTCK